jgi:hypothetical protein
MMEEQDVASVESLGSILTLTVAMDNVSRAKGSWGLHAFMADVGIESSRRRRLVLMLGALRHRDMLLRDVVAGPDHEHALGTYAGDFYAFYTTLLEALPPTMVSVN